MSQIKQVPSKAPKTIDQQMPFEIVIRTKDRKYIEEGGASAELVLPCKGYMLAATVDGGTTIHGQGEVNERGIVLGMGKHIDHKELFLEAALGAILGGDAE